MKNIAEITEAIRSTVASNSYFINEGFLVERASTEPDNPNELPWLGIYRVEVIYDPRSIGTARVDTDTDNWQGVVRALVIIKDQIAYSNDGDAGAELEDRIELHVKNFLDLVLGDRTLNQNIDMITAMKVRYSYDRNDEETVYVYSAMIELTLEVTTS